MNIKIRLLIAAVLGTAGCEGINMDQILGGLGGSNIKVVSASYGQNCGAPAGNVTSQVAQACSRSVSKCDYRVDVNTLGDPRQGCAKSFEVEYQCSGGATQKAAVPPEANNQTVTLQCSA
jgi:hypothetical protein